MTRRTGRPIWIYALVALLGAGSLYLAFELGRYQSGYSLLDQRRERATFEQRLTEELGVSDELRRQLAIAETGSDIDRATYSQVETTLGELQAKIQAQEEELVFYRGIVSPQDGVAGLRIQSLEVLPSDGESRCSPPECCGYRAATRGRAATAPAALSGRAARLWPAADNGRLGSAADCQASA